MAQQLLAAKKQAVERPMQDLLENGAAPPIPSPVLSSMGGHFGRGAHSVAGSDAGDWDASQSEEVGDVSGCTPATL